MRPIDLDLVRDFCELAETHNFTGLDISYKDFKLKFSRLTGGRPRGAARGRGAIDGGSALFTATGRGRHDQNGRGTLASDRVLLPRSPYRSPPS